MTDCKTLIVYQPPSSFTFAERLQLRLAAERKDWKRVDAINTTAIIRAMGVPARLFDVRELSTYGFGFSSQEGKTRMQQHIYERIVNEIEKERKR